MSTGYASVVYFNHPLPNLILTSHDFSNIFHSPSITAGDLHADIEARLGLSQLLYSEILRNILLRNILLRNILMNDPCQHINRDFFKKIHPGVDLRSRP
jgi:hypothetical protein